VPGPADDAQPAGARVPVVEARGISKRFGHVVALSDVSLELYQGEVLGVVGDNGAGKSTLMKCLSGLHPPSAGEILVEGRPVRLGSPADARGLGIEMVYQDLALAGNLRIDENIFLGRELTRRYGPLRVVDHKANRERAIEHLDKLHIEVKSVSQRVEQLSGGQRQAVAIARAIYWNARLMIMDEPTNNLGVPEQRKVLELISTLRSQGVPVILISHTLPDVFAVADRIVIMHRGRKVAEKRADETNMTEVVEYMVGARVDAVA
jgi:ABC-type sugar transport system ATPase subunit